MTTLAKIEKFQPATSHFSNEQVDLIKNSICKGATNEELQFFLMACQRSGLDPFAKQIYSVPRGGQRTIQTSVDGFRLIADRTGKYAPGKEPTFEYDKNGNLISATSYVMKQTKDGTWHEVSANACFNEYNAGSPLWKKMPRAMLSKCAECLALRKSFPAEMSGLYGQEEMDQADKADHVKPLYISDNQPKLLMSLDEKQRDELMQLFEGCSEDAKKGIISVIMNKFKVKDILDLYYSQYDWIRGLLVERYKHNQSILLEKEMAIKGDEVEVLE